MKPEIMEGIRRHVQSIRGMENAQILEIGPGHSKLSVDVIPEALNLYGNAHGGFLFSLCDMAAGMSAYAYEIANVTQASNIQFLRGISEGTIYIEANALHKGRTTLVQQVQVTDSNGKLLANASFTMFFLKPIVTS